MRFREHFKVVRRGASVSFDRREPSTFGNGMCLCLTIVLAFVAGAERVDAAGWDAASYVLFVAVWLPGLYLTTFTVRGHVLELEERLVESDESLQAIRESVAGLPWMGLLPFLFLS